MTSYPFFITRIENDFYSDESDSYRVHQTPCEDRCEEVKFQIANNQRLKEEGKRLQKEYIEAAKAMKNPGEASENGNNFGLKHICAKKWVKFVGTQKQCVSVFLT